MTMLAANASQAIGVSQIETVLSSPGVPAARLLRLIANDGVFRFGPTKIRRTGNAPIRNSAWTLFHNASVTRKPAQPTTAGRQARDPRVAATISISNAVMN